MSTITCARSRRASATDAGHGERSPPPRESVKLEPSETATGIVSAGSEVVVPWRIHVRRGPEFGVSSDSPSSVALSALSTSQICRSASLMMASIMSGPRPTAADAT